ncbi:MAG: Holliday junction resolvase RuvX [Clostridiales bacterium]|nr:Holliday junction resolvase RuvX [Clostridiales bacterium]
MGRIMGLDYGSVTMGVAVSDELWLTAQGLEVIRRKEENKLRHTLQRIEQLIEQYDVELIVLGYPKNMNNTEGERCQKSEALKETLERRTGLEVVLWDERLSTVSAHRSMLEGNLSRERRAKNVDMIAAVFILQNYLERLNYQKNRKENEDGR